MKRFRHPKSGHERVLDEGGPVFVSPFAKGEDWNYRTVKGKGYVMEAEVVDDMIDLGRLKGAVAAAKEVVRDRREPYNALAQMKGMMALGKKAVIEADESDAMEDAQEAAYQRGWRDAVKAMYVPGASLEMAHRLTVEARRLKL